MQYPSLRIRPSVCPGLNSSVSWATPARPMGVDHADRSTGDGPSALPVASAPAEEVATCAKEERGLAGWSKSLYPQ